MKPLSVKLKTTLGNRVFPYCTKLVMLSFLYCFGEKSKIISVNIPPVGIEPGTFGLWDLLFIHYHAFLIEAA